MKDLKELDGLINEYKRATSDALKALYSEFGEEELFLRVCQRLIPRGGKFGSKDYYFFHGIGCSVEHEGLEIELEFDGREKVGGFDSWRLYIFAASQKHQFPSFQEHSKVESGLVTLLQMGLLKSVKSLFSGSSYYVSVSHSIGSIQSFSL